MRVVVQRSSRAKVSVNHQVIGKIDFGLVLLVGFGKEDDASLLETMVEKIINLRIFEDDKQQMNLSLIDVNGQVLSISQFTLLANTKKGRRPSYAEAMEPLKAKALYEQFNHMLIGKGIKVETGCFGEHMELDFINDGPVTILLDSDIIGGKKHGY